MKNIIIKVGCWIGILFSAILLVSSVSSIIIGIILFKGLPLFETGRILGGLLITVLLLYFIRKLFNIQKNLKTSSQ